MKDPVRAHQAGQAGPYDEDEARYRQEAAEYIADLTGTLADMARKHGLDALSFILNMAKLEAQNATRHLEGRP
jgi:hypothetical protein